MKSIESKGSMGFSWKSFNTSPRPFALLLLWCRVLCYTSVFHSSCNLTSLSPEKCVQPGRSFSLSSANSSRCFPPRSALFDEIHIFHAANTFLTWKFPAFSLLRAHLNLQGKCFCASSGKPFPFQKPKCIHAAFLPFFSFHKNFICISKRISHLFSPPCINIRCDACWRWMKTMPDFVFCFKPEADEGGFHSPAHYRRSRFSSSFASRRRIAKWILIAKRFFHFVVTSRDVMRKFQSFFRGCELPGEKVFVRLRNVARFFESSCARDQLVFSFELISDVELRTSSCYSENQLKFTLSSWLVGHHSRQPS